MKEYKSYKEINRDLKILKLQKEIYKEEVKLNYQLTKKYGSPIALIKTAAESLKMTVKEKTYVAKRVAEEYFDKFSNKPERDLEIKVERVERIPNTDTAIAGSANITPTTNPPINPPNTREI